MIRPQPYNRTKENSYSEQIVIGLKRASSWGHNIERGTHRLFLEELAVGKTATGDD